MGGTHYTTKQIDTMAESIVVISEKLQRFESNIASKIRDVNETTLPQHVIDLCQKDATEIQETKQELALAMSYSSVIDNLKGRLTQICNEAEQLQTYLARLPAVKDIPA
jgi:hypothetical protein